MAAENSSSHVPIDIQSELYLHPTDSPNFSPASQKLNGENFPQWKRSAEIALRARNKLGFVDGSSKPPDVSSPTFAQWNRCNNLVIFWILHSVESGIANSVLYCESAKEIWEDLDDRFGQSNAPKLFQLHKEIVTLVQVERFFKIHGYPKSSKGYTSSNDQGSQARKIAGNVVSETENVMTGQTVNTNHVHHSAELPMSLTSAQYNQRIALLNKDNLSDRDDGGVPGFLSSHMASSGHLAGARGKKYTCALQADNLKE
ncbi:unnamed protein product [Cuscuta campestris]|uniref:Retrotransposon Copia-like N-terminal domain-containing protein n=1 Tax=Cuscuta campestris TaxID=132261 RepID=A0A484KNW2_9ASTE|nr:unnamed protein product [Cuscuta campestris]